MDGTVIGMIDNIVNLLESDNKEEAILRIKWLKSELENIKGAATDLASWI